MTITSDSYLVYNVLVKNTRDFLNKILILYKINIANKKTGKNTGFYVD